MKGIYLIRNSQMILKVIKLIFFCLKFFDLKKDQSGIKLRSKLKHINELSI